MTFIVGNENFWGHDALDTALDYLRDPDAPAVERPRAATMREVPRTNTKDDRARCEVAGVELAIKRLTKRLARDEAQKEGWEGKAKREGV